MGNLGGISRKIFRFSAIVGALALVACGSGLDKERGKKPAPPTNNIPYRITGTFITTDAAAFALDDISGGIVLTFGMDSCITCIEEAKHFSEFFARMGSLPKNVTFVTVLVDGNLEDAGKFKQDHRMQWIVGIDDSNALFRKYCPQGTTPCTLTYNATTGQSRMFARKVTVGEVESETGTWVY